MDLRSSSNRMPVFVAAVVLGPSLLFWHLHAMWNSDGAYAYGWVVPFLTAFFCKSRWDDRPPPSAPVKGGAFLVIVFALMTLPALWLLESSPERGICIWSYAFFVVAISLCLIALAGGRAWLEWFSFPVVLILTAVPWPHSLELRISNFIMSGTAGVTSEILCVLGIPSEKSGNLVHIETGVIDIDEACSGIRSLQAMVMITFCLGELFRLKPARRLWLMAFGLPITLMANILRTVVLSSIGFRHGIGAVDRYHDAAGVGVLAFSLLGALVAAFLFRPKTHPGHPSDASGTGVPLPLNLSIALLIWFMAAEISVEAWYRFHEMKWQGWTWTVRWPRNSREFRFIEIPKRSRRILMCDESRAAYWREAGAGEWLLYWIRWNPGNTAAEAAKVHRPDVCLTAEGAIMEKDLGVNLTSVGEMRIPFHSYIFRMAEKTFYVFFCVYEQRSGDDVETWNPRFEGVDVLDRAIKGRRHMGLQSLEFAVFGYPSEQSAQQAFSAGVGALVQCRLSRNHPE